ncbi:MAG: oxygenase MpaB family protein, partial [Mycobacterium sp.]
VWDQLFRPMVAGQRWIAAGLFDPALREKAGMRWTPSDEVVLRLFGKAVEIAFLAVPDEIRLHPRALAAYRRASGQEPADAPLVEAPFFVDAPRDRKGMPMHYAPHRKSPLPEVLARRAGSLVHTTFSLAGLRPARGRRPAA